MVRLGLVKRLLHPDDVGGKSFSTALFCFARLLHLKTGFS
jgi:hypothetical protein